MNISYEDARERIEAITQTFDKESAFEWWVRNSSLLGVYEINEAKRTLSLRISDSTPSAHINADLSYVDYGGEGRKFSVLTRIMEVNNVGFIEAMKIFLKIENSDIPTEEFQSRVIVKKKTATVNPYKNSFLRRTLIDKSKFKNEYELLAKDLFRGCSESEKKHAEKVLNIGYCPVSQVEENTYVDRIFIPEMDENSVAYGSYKYNRNDSTKGLLRKGAKRILFGSHLHNRFGKNVLYVEGHSDAVINIAKGYATVSTGSSTKRFEENISILKGKTIYDFPDLDIAGMKGAMSRHNEILIWNSTASAEDQIKHIIFWWSDWFHSADMFQKIVEGKITKSDQFYLIAAEVPLKKDHAHINRDLLYKIQVDICEKNKWNIEDFTIFNWKVVFKGQNKKNGFDFADMYQLESEELKILNNFLQSKVSIS